MGPEKLEHVAMFTSLAVMKPIAQPDKSSKPVHILGLRSYRLCEICPFCFSEAGLLGPMWAAEDWEYTVILSSVIIYVPGSKSHSPCAQACLLMWYFSSDCSLVMVANSLVLIWAIFINITAGRFLKRQPCFQTEHTVVGRSTSTALKETRDFLV